MTETERNPRNSSTRDYLNIAESINETDPQFSKTAVSFFSI